MDISTLVGDLLLKKDLTDVKAADISTNSGSVIGLYFSAHWCPPCRAFTPKLASVYNELKTAQKDFEVIFVSSDSGEEEFKSYLNDMPWLAIPFDNEDKKDGCSEKYEISGLPTLVLLDGETGEVITNSGRGLVDEYGADAFPFNETRVEECKKEKKEKKDNALAEMEFLSFMNPLVKIDKNESDEKVETLINSCEALAVAFLFDNHDPGSSPVISKLVKVQKELGKDKLGLVVVPLQDVDDIEENDKLQLKDVLMVKSGESSNNVKKRFEEIFSAIDAPHVTILKKKDDKTLSICAEEAARDIYFKGSEGFPWSSEALEALEAKERAFKEELKSKQKDLEFLRNSEESSISLVHDKNKSFMKLSALQSNDVVGLYFSAHWCGPCRGFTPKLADLYNKCKEKNKKFEIVFLSSDHDEKEFKEYYEDMPWCALSYEERGLKSSLSDIYDVQGIPTLILLNGKGELISEDGRDIVRYGEEYYPWDEESIEKAKEEEQKKKLEKLKKAKEEEENVVDEQEKAGKIVLRRHIGEPSFVKVSADHHIEFKDFSTVVASSARIPEGAKVFYEVVFRGYDDSSRGMQVSQIGWAIDGFEASDEYKGDGVGDCDYSYGFDGQRQCKWHSGAQEWGKEFDPEEGTVLGVAADMEKGELSFGLNGDWKEPMGIAFQGLDKSLNLYPALTASELKLQVNFGDNDFKYGPPDSSFIALKEALKK